MNDAAFRKDWEPRIRRFLAGQPGADPAHGEVHLRRVVATATRLAAANTSPSLSRTATVAWTVSRGVCSGSPSGRSSACTSTPTVAPGVRPRAWRASPDACT